MWWRRLIEYLGIISGSIIVGIGLNALLIPNRIAAGGASGIATIIYHLWGWSPGIVLLAINIPLLIASFIVFGPRFGIYTILGSLATSLAVEFTQGAGVLTQDPLLASIYGGVVTGIGMGIVFRFRGSTGGTDILAKFVTHYSGVSIGQALLFIDAAVVLLAGLVFTAEYAMYALIAIFVSTKLIDVVLEGIYSAKALFIISHEADKIAAELMTRLERGVTMFPSKGGFSKEEKTTLLCVVGRMELSRAKQVVLEIDHTAFIVVTEAHEVLGEGFAAP